LRIRLSDARTCTQHKLEASGSYSIGSGIRQLANTQGVDQVYQSGGAKKALNFPAEDWTNAGLWV